MRFGTNVDRRSPLVSYQCSGNRYCKTEGPASISLRERWLKHPQKLWLRKALFQIHLWAGVGFSLYVLLMCVSGTILIYRVEIERALSRQPQIAIGPGSRMTTDELKHIAKRYYPKYDVTDVTEPRNPSLPAEISLERGRKKLQRLFNPFTGTDLGDYLPRGYFFMEWLARFHDHLLYRPVGRVVNGIGGLIVTLLCLTGAVIWWPGNANWRRSLTVTWKADRRRLNWALHSALGFWSIVFIFLWGISGIYLAVPEPFEAAADFLKPTGASATRVPSFGDVVLDWLARLHFGRFGGVPTKIVWTVFGVVPIVLVITGICMWWVRIVRPRLRRSAISQTEIPEVHGRLPPNFHISD